jgi:hypothetical protein
MVANSENYAGTSRNIFGSNHNHSSGSNHNCGRQQGTAAKAVVAY